MSSGIEIVAEISFENPSQMQFYEDDDVVEAVSANASDEPFRKRILPRTLRSCKHLFNAHSLNPAAELITVDSVSVTDQIARCSVFRKRFDDLLSRPFRGGMFGHIEVDHTPALMCQDHEHEQYAQL